MTALSDTMTMGLVLVLLFGSICLYLYTRIQQAEQKMNLVESILLDLKIASEVKSYPVGASLMGSSIAPAALEPYIEEIDIQNDAASVSSGSRRSSSNSITRDTLKPFVDHEEQSDEHLQSEVVVEAAAVAAAADTSSVALEHPQQDISVNYEAMTMKELQALAKQRGVVGASQMRRAQVLEALKTSDRASRTLHDTMQQLPGSSEVTTSPAPFQPFLETESA